MNLEKKIKNLANKINIDYEIIIKRKEVLDKRKTKLLILKKRLLDEKMINNNSIEECSCTCHAIGIVCDKCKEESCSHRVGGG